MGRTYTNAHIWVKRFREAGVAGFPGSGKIRSAPVYGDDATTEVIKAAAARQVGLKFTTWSLPKLRSRLRRQPGLESIRPFHDTPAPSARGLWLPHDGQTWCESQDPDFRSKKNKIVRLYRRPPRDGIVVCVDEMGPLATIPRGGHS